jgi:general secretion pathway protein G
MISNHKKNGGFSLTELVIVVSVLTVLAAIVAPQVGKLVQNSKIGRLEADLKNIKKGLISLRADLGVFPADIPNSNDPGLMRTTLVPSQYRGNWKGPYMEHWPTDNPWAGTYAYEYRDFNNFNFDGSGGNEVYITISSLTKDILNRIDEDLDDGNRNTGLIRHDDNDTLLFYIGEGPRW